MTAEIIMSGDYDLLHRALGPTPECPAFPDLVSGLHEGDRAMVEHAAHCPHCSGELKLYDKFMSAQVSDEESAAVKWVQRHLRNPAVRAEPWWSFGAWGNFRTLAPAAIGVAALVMAVSASVDREPSGSFPAITDVSERAGSVEMVSPKGDLAAEPDTFRWNTVPGAVAYRVTLMEVDQSVLWESGATSNSVILPAQIRGKALPGKRLIWQVEAVDGLGRAIASGRQDFRRQIKQRG